MDGYITSVCSPDLATCGKPYNVVDIVIASLWAVGYGLLEPIKLMSARAIKLIEYYDLLVINELDA